MKLHELLAVETSLETQATKVRADLGNTFEKKRHLFEEKRLLFTPNEEGKPQVTEQQSDIQSTVRKELDWIQTHIAKFWDASFQIASANTFASANIELENGTVLAESVPATFLLELQKRLQRFSRLPKRFPR